MGIAKSLRKSGYLSMLASGLADVLNKMNEDDSENEYLRQVADTKQKVSGRFQPQPNADKKAMIDSLSDPFFQGGPPMRRELAMKNVQQEPDTVQPDLNAAGNQSLNDIADFVISNLGKKNVDPNTMKSAVEGLSLYRSSLIPPKPEKKNLKAVNPEFNVIDENTGQIIIPGKEKKNNVKVGDQFKGVSARGYYEVDYSDPNNPGLKWVPNPDYKVGGSGKGKDDEYKDPSKLIGEVSEAISKVQMIKSAKPNKSGNYSVPDPYGLGTYELTQQELTTLKEQVKNRYTSEAVTLYTQQGLTNAVEDIRAILNKTGKTTENLPKALAKFKELNPDVTDDQLRILEDYFTLELL
jgi:hypothetical protein